MFVLNIDDDEDDGFIFIEAVKEVNPTITCLFIAKPKDAIALLSDDMGIMPDYIFLDINMPEMNGRECLVEIRKMTKLKDVPIVMFSTAILDKDMEQFGTLNAGFVQKPGNFDSLKAALRKILDPGFARGV